MSGFPHSEICGSKVAHTSPQLIAACHVLHRLYMPRHPRIALTSRLRVHTTNDNAGLDQRPNQNSAEQRCRGILVWMIIISARLMGVRHGRNRNRRPVVIELAASLQPAEAGLPLKANTITASILRTHSQCQRGARCSVPRGEPRGSRIFI
jgi:hypothetical protein